MKRTLGDRVAVEMAVADALADVEVVAFQDASVADGVVEAASDVSLNDEIVDNEFKTAGVELFVMSVGLTVIQLQALDMADVGSGEEAMHGGRGPIV